jgi:hypothetical protein
MAGGMRDYIRFLCKYKLVDVIVTTGGLIDDVQVVFLLTVAKNRRNRRRFHEVRSSTHIPLFMFFLIRVFKMHGSDVCDWKV